MQGIMSSPALRYPKSLWSYNPIPGGCVLYLPLWHPSLSGPVFKSIDPYGHICTATGATYGSTGRTFDAVDDVIACGSVASLDNIFDGGGTLGVWFKATSDGENDNGFIISKSSWRLEGRSEAVGKMKLRLYIPFTGDDGVWTTTATEVTIGQFDHLLVTYNADSVANDPIFYINSVAKTVGSGLTEDVAPTNTRNDDAASAFLIGDDSGSTHCIEGIVGEVEVCNRILTATEGTYLNNKTKFRYT